MPRLSTTDPSSYSQPELVKIKHIDIDWTIDFGTKRISGFSTIQFVILTKFIEEIVSTFLIFSNTYGYDNYYKSYSYWMLAISMLNLSISSMKDVKYH